MKVGFVVIYVGDTDMCARFWTDTVGMVERQRFAVGSLSVMEVGFADQEFSLQLVPLEMMLENPDNLDLATPSIAFRKKPAFFSRVVARVRPIRLVCCRLFFRCSVRPIGRPKKIPLILSAVRRQAPLMRRPLRVALIILKKASRTCWAFGARSKLSRSTALTPWA